MAKHDEKCMILHCDLVITKCGYHWNAGLLLYINTVCAKNSENCEVSVFSTVTSADYFVKVLWKGCLFLLSWDENKLVQFNYEKVFSE